MRIVDLVIVLLFIFFNAGKVSLMVKKVVAIVGSYRKGGTIDSVIDAILDGARESGAEVEKIYLIDKLIKSCCNCRICTQEAGLRRGVCVQQDDMDDILNRIEAADALVLGSPTNFYTVTAVTKQFMERLVCYAYWPWGAGAPTFRNTRHTKQAVVVASSAAPALVARLTCNIVGLLKKVVKLLGAKRPRVLFIGMAAMEEKQGLPEKVKAKAQMYGRELS